MVEETAVNKKEMEKPTLPPLELSIDDHLFVEKVKLLGNMNRIRILQLAMNGVAQSHIPKLLNLHHSTVSYYVGLLYEMKYIEMTSRNGKNYIQTVSNDIRITIPPISTD